MINVRERIGLVLSLVTFTFFCPSPVTAASLLSVCNSSSSENCPADSIAFPVYKNVGGVATFNYKIDQGNLGELSETEASTDAQEVLNLWQDESSLNFVPAGDGQIEVDVNVNNYDPYINNESSLGYSPVVWDSDGSITDDMLGNGSKESVLGFAGATFFTLKSDGSINNIKESQSVFNGYLFDGDNTGDSPSGVRNLFLTTILHEFGHMFGIDHSQGGNLEGFNNGDGDLTDVPVMFPVAANPLVELQQDDIAAARHYYPRGDEKEDFGIIRGTLTKDGKQVKGISVVAFKTDDDNPRKRAVACPSDVDGQGNGKFVIPGLVPGEYILFAEAVDPSFTGGSSIGIHEPNENFQSVFYNGDGEVVIQSSNLNSGLSQAKRLTVSNGTNLNVSFEINADGSGENPGSTEASFSLKGAAVSKVLFLKVSKPSKLKLKLVNLNPGKKVTVQLSTDYPNLISFLPKDTVKFKTASKIIEVRYASYSDFISVFPELDTEEVSQIDIPLTVEDLTTGYIDETKTLSVF